VEDVRWSALGGRAEAGYRKAGGNVESREVHGCDCEGVFPRVEDVPGERAHDFDKQFECCERVLVTAIGSALLSGLDEVELIDTYKIPVRSLFVRQHSTAECLNIGIRLIRHVSSKSLLPG
jgi:hypothetical protein